MQNETDPNESPTVHYEDAPKNLRLANYLIDVVVYLVFSFVVGVFTTLLGLSEIITSVNEYVLGFFFIMFYYSMLEGLTGRTIGKFITGTKVIMVNGTRPNFDTILGRSLCRLIPFEPLSFLFSETGWHDRITKTRVVMIENNSE